MIFSKILTVLIQKLDKLLTRFKENGLIRDYIYHKKQQAVYSAEILI